MFAALTRWEAADEEVSELKKDLEEERRLRQKAEEEMAEMGKILEAELNFD